jgi:hypothetical protein
MGSTETPPVTFTLKLVPPNGEKPISLMLTMSILSRRIAPSDNLILPTPKGCPDTDVNVNQHL